ncbi:hypothetical protein ON010_g14749 [Phytophthora cinnamomi]|nr:hypothetical protein ON010_g14749 [Phytophthora cinnamomi]
MALQHTSLNPAKARDLGSAGSKEALKNLHLQLTVKLERVAALLLTWASRNFLLVRDFEYLCYDNGHDHYLAPVFRTPKFAVPAVAHLYQSATDDEAAALISVVTGACASAAMIAAVDKRSVRAPPSGTSTFRNTTFEETMNATTLTILYLAQGCTMDAAASMLGISSPRAVVYINDTLDVVNELASPYVGMVPPSEIPEIEKGFEAIAGFPDVIGAVDGTLSLWNGSGAIVVLHATRVGGGG